MAAKVVTRPTFAVTSTQKLFDIPGYIRDGGFHAYEPTPDGKRFLMLRQEVLNDARDGLCDGMLAERVGGGTNPRLRGREPPYLQTLPRLLGVPEIVLHLQA